MNYSLSFFFFPEYFKMAKPHQIYIKIKHFFHTMITLNTMTKRKVQVQVINFTGQVVKTSGYPSLSSSNTKNVTAMSNSQVCWQIKYNVSSSDTTACREAQS